MSQRPALDPTRRQTLAAVARRILPSDDGVGAAETGVAEYIEKTLREEAQRADRPLIEAGLDLLDSLARERCGQAFAETSPRQQDEILTHLEQLEQPVPRTFLRRLVHLALEGFLCHPRRGGNRDGLGWRSIGYLLEEEADDVPEPRSHG